MPDYRVEVEIDVKGHGRFVVALPRIVASDVAAVVDEAIRRAVEARVTSVAEIARPALATAPTADAA